MHSLESVLKRDRVVLGTALVGLTALAWMYLAHEARVMYHTGICSCCGMRMSGPDTGPWSATTLLPLFLMWAEMMVAMMLPTAAPMLLTFAMVNRRRQEQQRPFVPTGLFLLGYLAIWTGFSALAAGTQWVLHGATLLSPMMTGTSRWLAGGLLIVAAAFQFSPWKHACLTHCRSPLQFLMSDWREGRWGAFVMGLRHGAFCTGCCWALMALLFVLGVMNVLWIAVLTIWVLLEKVGPRGPVLGRVSGVLLGLWGVWILLANSR